MKPSKKVTLGEGAKLKALRETGTLHAQPDKVTDEAFQTHDFFDPQDRVQVRYEMLRRHRFEGRPVKEVAGSFGFSRQAFYMAERAFQSEGIAGLVPQKRGPKSAHKCTDDILDFVDQWVPSAQSGDLIEAIRKRFGVTVNPRSIDRAIARRKKKRLYKREAK